MSREVRISTVALMMTSEIRREVGGLIEQAFRMVDLAAKAGSDIICLPENYDMLARPPEAERAFKGEPIPGGPITTRMQEKAAKNRCHIINDILELTPDGSVFNTATVIGRDGGIVGKYRKTHLAPDEFEYARAGNELPVFQCDFGKMAVMICADLHYPEIARTYALKGADIIFWPTMVADGSPRLYGQLINSRAIDNQVFYVVSDYIYVPDGYGRPTGEARIVDPTGTIRAGTGRRPGVATAVVDLDQSPEKSADGSPPTDKERFMGWRRPELYEALCNPKTGVDR